MKKRQTQSPKIAKTTQTKEPKKETGASPMHSLIQQINDAVVIIDVATGQYVDCNSHMEKMFGYTREQLLSMKAGELTVNHCPQSPEKFERLESGQSLSGISRMLTSGGEGISVRYSSSPLSFNEKKYTLNVLRDIREEERAKKELRDMSRFPEENPNPVLRISEEGVLLYGNGASAEILKSWGETLVGDMIPQQVFQKITNTSSSKITIEASKKTYLISIVRIPKRGYINLYGQDVTEKKKSDELVLMLTRAVEQSSASIVITDTKGNIEYVNPWFCKTSGYTSEEVIGKNPRILKSGHTKPEEYKRLWDTIRSGKEWRGEFYNKKKNGDLYWESASLSPIKNKIGEITHFLAVKEDITEQKNAEEAKNTFIAIMSHELRNPLAPIAMNAELLEHYFLETHEKHELSEPEIKEAVSIITRQSKVMSRLLDDLLDISRIIHGKIILKKEKTDLALCIKNALDTATPFIKAQKHALTVNMSSLPVCLYADPVRIEQIIINLLNNAAKYTKPGGNINLSVEIDNDTAVIKVRDTGIGILSENVQKIFELFTRSSKPFAEINGDFGIGLSLVKKIVRLHGGTIEAVSEGLNKGSEFIVRLPIQKNAEAEKVNIDDEKTLPAHGRKILIVDDNEDIAHSLQRILSHFGHTLSIVHNGKNALSEAVNFKPELVLLDIGLPDMTGYDVARRLREQYGKEIKIVAMTGYGQEKDKAMAKEAGFNFHLTKPVSINDINKVIEQCFEGDEADGHNEYQG